MCGLLDVYLCDKVFSKRGLPECGNVLPKQPHNARILVGRFQDLLDHVIGKLVLRHLHQRGQPLLATINNATTTTIVINIAIRSLVYYITTIVINNNGAINAIVINYIVINYNRVINVVIVVNGIVNSCRF